jgi:hypothetical protein
MTLANPLGLLWGLLSVPMVILYLRRMPLRRRPVATSMIWEQVLAGQPARSRWQRWRDPLSLVVQLTILLLLVVALAEPLTGPRRRVVLVVDNSAGQEAGDGQPTLARAKQSAGRLIAGLGPGDAAVVLSAGGAPSVRCNLTSDTGLLAEAVQAISSSQAPPQVDATVALARQMLSTAPGGVGAAEDVVVLGGSAGEEIKDYPERAGPPGGVVLVGLAVLLLAGQWCLYQRCWMS